MASAELVIAAQDVARQAHAADNRPRRVHERIDSALACVQTPMAQRQVARHTVDVAGRDG